MLAGYYLHLGWKEILHRPWTTAVMVVAIGMGVGASFTMLTLTALMSNNPLPNSHLYTVELDPRPSAKAGAQHPEQLTWIDSSNLLSSARAEHQAAMVGGKVAIIPPVGTSGAFYVRARYTTSEFFEMFRVPFDTGASWGHADDLARARIAVISEQLARRLFGDHAVGQYVTVGSSRLRIIGVMGSWSPGVHFYDLGTGPYEPPEDIFIPLDTAMELKLPIEAKITCWSKTDLTNMKSAPCAWIQYWVQLRSADDSVAFMQYLRSYADQQVGLGRFERNDVALYSLGSWIDKHHLVPPSVRIEVFLAFGFLVVCLANAAALLFVRFIKKNNELAIRRAMGANKRAVFAQLLCQASVIGIGGGCVGAVATYLGIKFVQAQAVEYARIATVHGTSLVLAILFGVIATMLAAFYPAWRASAAVPGDSLKLQ